ncbi:tetratricopeptide (TPR) repeat protein [Salirhabdus euzebyi]|uniref:Tetratricopeptide (TPR) repeat protein n=1 Tax=Salirhabdus euzebyi TaxID=394506 RepID=A0A841PRQ4_9BACI|nr:tetratricopeptide repeat protein [Salirhabdus euzebyi]MBB6451597.1 tetratricopeptide (TPR) repeat protein [Salirhabdus euzebyi]
MQLRHKSIEELLDLEQEIRVAKDEEQNGANYRAIDIYKHLYKKISADKDSEYAFSLDSIKRKLVWNLVQYGTYLKTVYQKDDIAAESSLKDAIKHDRYLPIAHYRLGFLSYKKQQYNLALHYFQEAIRLQSMDGDDRYKMNDQQLYQCHLYLANCGLFIAKEAKESLEELNLDVNLNELSNYTTSPLYDLINENNRYLETHAYKMITKTGSRFGNKEDCEEMLECKSTLILDLTGRRNMLLFNSKEVSLSKNPAEMLRMFFLYSNYREPLDKYTFSDLISNTEFGEYPNNTYTTNVRRLNEKITEAGVDVRLIENKPIEDRTTYYYNHLLPFVIMHRSDEMFILSE